MTWIRHPKNLLVILSLTLSVLLLANHVIVTHLTMRSRDSAKRNHLRVRGTPELGGPQSSDKDVNNGRDENGDGGYEDGSDDDDSEENLDDEMEKMKHSPYIIREQQELARISRALRPSKVKYLSGYLPYENLNRYSFRRCLFQNCEFVNNMSEADAVMFSARSIRDHPIKPFYRPESQRWVFYTYDPAEYNYCLDRADIVSSFNLTSTYQLDSDFPLIFGRLRRRKLPPKDYDAIFEGKTKGVAWFVSHCTTWSKRELYVEGMRSVLGVDVFGQCGELRCGPIHYRTNDTHQCFPMLSKEYKFYLAFENSFCQDYITEKFFKLFSDVDVIPVVRGGFEYKKYLPTGTFIDAADFESPKALARFLQQLGQNKTEYIKILKRKNRWVSEQTPSIHCHVCEMLHEMLDKPRRIDDLRLKFYGEPRQCRQPTDLIDL
ncbi:3-galactosyl-N-acetylglucosaminide 4-alpha-L-fucosyltransferase FUT3-like [Physella acuta]|uniref:3-galactosyl-N-acetylglucosaminide 4-alpha-L-fucosyltransferase FUT3-like n=1 Tax=Physella acuta TaxID=109671 RepID=UPI0027DB930C|nr:3-galactosyl-N-acetylglucosaminide 4-alpha-L-fucosyltransferase FUT3-like [Physella acuta]